MASPRDEAWPLEDPGRISVITSSGNVMEDREPWPLEDPGRISVLTAYYGSLMDDLEAGGKIEKEKDDDRASFSSSASSIAGATTPTRVGSDESAVTRTKTRVSVNDASAIPDGGLVAWLQVAGAFSLFFNSWGIVNTFGVYQTFYEEGTLFQASSSQLSWIGAVQSCLLLLVGSISGPIYDAGYFRWLIIGGSLLAVFGQMMVSLCTEYWEVLLAQGFCIGIGCGLLFIPSVAIISTYFTTKVSLAVGIAASGSSLGGVIYPIVFHELEPQIGFGWATRVIGFIMLATLIVPNLVMKVRVLPQGKRKLFDLSAFKEWPYVFFCIGSLIGFAGLYVPFFYLSFYAISTGITTPKLGFYLLSILNAASIFGRIIPNFVADKTGPLNILVPCAFITSILIFAVIGVHNLAGIIVIAIFYGFFSGTFVSVPPAVFVTLSPNRGVIGTRMGMGFAVMSVGLLLGTPGAGAILGNSLDPSDQNFIYVWAYGGTLSCIGAILITLSRFSKTGLTLKVKA